MQALRCIHRTRSWTTHLLGPVCLRAAKRYEVLRRLGRHLRRLRPGVDEVRDLGNGVTFGLLLMRGRPARSSGLVELRYAGVSAWTDGLIEQVTTYLDMDEARAAAERLAKELE